MSMSIDPMPSLDQRFQIRLLPCPVHLLHTFSVFHRHVFLILECPSYLWINCGKIQQMNISLFFHCLYIRKFSGYLIRSFRFCYVHSYNPPPGSYWISKSWKLRPYPAKVLWLVMITIKIRCRNILSYKQRNILFNNNCSRSIKFILKY